MPIVCAELHPPHFRRVQLIWPVMHRDFPDWREYPWIRETITRRIAIRPSNFSVNQPTNRSSLAIIHWNVRLYNSFDADALITPATFLPSLVHLHADPSSPRPAWWSSSSSSSFRFSTGINEPPEVCADCVVGWHVTRIKRLGIISTSVCRRNERQDRELGELSIGEYWHAMNPRSFVNDVDVACSRRIVRPQTGFVYGFIKIR